MSDFNRIVGYLQLPDFQENDIDNLLAGLNHYPPKDETSLELPILQNDTNQLTPPLENSLLPNLDNLNVASSAQNDLELTFNASLVNVVDNEDENNILDLQLPPTDPSIDDVLNYLPSTPQDMQNLFEDSSVGDENSNFNTYQVPTTMPVDEAVAIQERLLENNSDPIFDFPDQTETTVDSGVGEKIVETTTTETKKRKIMSSETDEVTISSAQPEAAVAAAPSSARDNRRSRRSKSKYVYRGLIDTKLPVNKKRRRAQVNRETADTINTINREVKELNEKYSEEGVKFKLEFKHPSDTIPVIIVKKEGVPNMTVHIPRQYGDTLAYWTQGVWYEEEGKGPENVSHWYMWLSDYTRKEMAGIPISVSMIVAKWYELVKSRCIAKASASSL